jgi:hypothetical protein
MKNTFVGMLMLLSSFQLSAQIEKGHVLLTGFGNYSKNEYSERFEVFEPKQRTVSSLNLGGSIGYFFSNRLIVGAGIDYQLDKDGPYGWPGQNFESAERDFKFKQFLPYAFMGCYLPIVPNLYFNTNVKIMFGQYAMFPTFDIETSEGNGPFAIKVRTLREDHFEAQITPELSYFFVKHVGVYLGLGGFSYIIRDWEKDQSGWVICVQPEVWKVGIKIGM